MKGAIFVSIALLAGVQALPALQAPVTFGAVHQTLANSSGPGSLDTRILGGLKATTGQFPFQVAYTTSNSADPVGFCGGTLISSTVVLTAAHCVSDYSQFEVILGTLRALDTGSANRVTMRSSRKVVHENWDYAYGLNNDIALIILPSPVQFTSTIQPILLPRRRDMSDDFVGKLATTSGWGKISDGPGFVNDDLLFVDIDIVPNSDCEWAYGPNYMPPTKMCISTKGGTTGPCNGDSGGPMFLKNSAGEEILVGITSFGASAGCESGFPDVDTRVTSFIEWVAANGGPAVRP